MFKFRGFIDPSDQNELYHTPLQSKIWDLTERNKNTKCPIDAHCQRHRRKDLRIQIWEASSLLFISSFVVSFSSLQQNLQGFLFWRQIGDAFSFVVVVHFIAEGDVKTEWSCCGCCTLRYNLNCWESSKTSLLDGIYWDLLGSIETDTWGARGRGAPCH